MDEWIKLPSWRPDQGNVSSGWKWTRVISQHYYSGMSGLHISALGDIPEDSENSIKYICSNGLSHFLYKFLLSRGRRGEQQDVTGWSNISVGEKKRPASQNPKWERRVMTGWKKQKIFPIRKATSQSES